MVELNAKRWNVAIQSPKGYIGYKSYDPHNCLMCFVAVLAGAENNRKESVDYNFHLTRGRLEEKLGGPNS